MYGEAVAVVVAAMADPRELLGQGEERAAIKKQKADIKGCRTPIKVSARGKSAQSAWRN